MEIRIVELFLVAAALLSFVSAATVDDPITFYTTGIRGRVESLEAKVCPRHIQNGNRPSMPSDIYKFMGELKDGYGGRQVFDAGHIISYQLGGPFERYNFYPQSMSYNRGVWSRTEDLFVRFINTSNKCSKLKFEFEYNNPQNPGIPTRINFTVNYSDGTSYSGHDDQLL